jgi:hypothetical protein
MNNLIFSLVTEPQEKKLVIDMCKCGECMKEFKVSDVIEETGHHNGWEMPETTEHECPECEGGGCIDDYWSSNDSLKEFYAATEESK